MPHDACDRAVEALAETLTETLDTMAFLAAEPADFTSCLPFPQAPADAVMAQMDFAGALSGRVRLVASRRFSMTLAANVLGLSAADPDAAVRADDCFKELLNVVVGALVSRLAASARDDFTLTVPRARAFATAEWPLFCDDANVRLLSAEGHTLAARLDAA